MMFGVSVSAMHYTYAFKHIIYMCTIPTTACVNNSSQSSLDQQKYIAIRI